MYPPPKWLLLLLLLLLLLWWCCWCHLLLLPPPPQTHTQVSVPLNLLDQGGYSVSQLMHLQAGGVVGAATCPDRHVLLAASEDGRISALDYRWVSLGGREEGPGVGAARGGPRGGGNLVHYLLLSTVGV